MQNNTTAELNPTNLKLAGYFDKHEVFYTIKHYNMLLNKHDFTPVYAVSKETHETDKTNEDQGLIEIFNRKNLKNFRILA